MATTGPSTTSSTEGRLVTAFKRSAIGPCFSGTTSTSLSSTRFFSSVATELMCFCIRTILPTLPFSVSREALPNALLILLIIGLTPSYHQRSLGNESKLSFLSARLMIKSALRRSHNIYISDQEVKIKGARPRSCAKSSPLTRDGSILQARELFLGGEAQEVMNQLLDSYTA